MNIWEFLKFLAMLIPTWLLLAALALTLSLPSNGGGEHSSGAAAVSRALPARDGGVPPSGGAAVPHSEDVVSADSEFVPLAKVVAR